VAYYSDDAAAALAEELVLFAALFNAILDKEKANLDHSAEKCIELQMYEVFVHC